MAIKFSDKIPDQVRLRAGAGSITLAAKEEGKDRAFSMSCFAGKAVSLGPYGFFAVQMSGIRCDIKIPILHMHDQEQRAGFALKKDITLVPKITLTGSFLKNQIAASIEQDSDDGFPFQCSIGIWRGTGAKDTQRVNPDEEVEVNGQKLKGPGLVYWSSHLREVSFCALGEDRNTNAKALSAEGAQFLTANTSDEFVQLSPNQEQEDKPMDPAQNQTAQPPVAPPVSAPPAAPARTAATFAELKAAFPRDIAFCGEQLDQGATLLEAKAAWGEKLELAEQKRVALENSGVKLGAEFAPSDPNATKDDPKKPPAQNLSTAAQYRLNFEACKHELRQQGVSPEKLNVHAAALCAQRHSELQKKFVAEYNPNS